MIIAQYFVSFIFYSFLGWIWESIYCTIQKKEWQDRGFLFGPICPIYGSCMVVVTLIFTKIHIFHYRSVPLWQIFLICMIGSAIAEFITSWVLEARFHARWWDYSKVPLNIQGRICLPVSVGFGLAGIVVVRYVLPAMGNAQTHVHPILYEVLAIVFAMLLGADIALTEASLSTLLGTVEEYKVEWNRRAEATYSNLAATPQRIGEGVALARETLAEGASAVKTSVMDGTTTAKNTVTGGLAAAKETLTEGASAMKNTVSTGTERMRERADAYVGRLSFNQKRILGNIETFSLKEEEKKLFEISPGEHMKNALKRRKQKNKSIERTNRE